MLLLLLSSCKKDKEVQTPVFEKETFILMSHTYVLNAPVPTVDSLIQKIPLANYNLVFLGGDLTASSSQFLSTLYYIDSIFDVSSPGTLWAVGNHDYDNTVNLTAVTHKPLFYAYYHNGITFLVLDTQDSLSNFVGEQLQLIKNVTDTIAESGSLIVLTHQLVWMMDNGVMQPTIDSISNGPAGTCFWCINPNNFYTDVYPRLLQVKNRGIKVMCLAGDIGEFVQQFSFTNADGIPFIASGICSGCAVNYCIVFEYDPNTRELSYNYRLLTELATN